MSKKFNIHDWQYKQRLAEIDEDLDEANVTGTGTSISTGDSPAYATPFAFGKKKDKDIEVLGYKKVNEKTDKSKIPHRKSGYMGYSEPVEETDMSIREVLDMNVIDENITEAKYKGKTVTLNKPMRGDVKKFKVYVNTGKKNADGSIKVKKVNFGHGGTSAKRPTMRIRKSDPKRRKAFRARHRCDNPGPKTMARYWSCKKW